MDKTRTFLSSTADLLDKFGINVKGAGINIFPIPNGKVNWIEISHAGIVSHDRTLGVVGKEHIS